jgi:hypothetical protein
MDDEWNKRLLRIARMFAVFDKGLNDNTKLSCKDYHLVKTIMMIY